MIKFLKTVQKNKKLVKNFSYLSLLQIFSILIPLLTYPYLIMVLGVKNYGLLAFTQAIAGYILILVNFGFNITASKEVSVFHNDPKKIGGILYGITIIKSVLFIAGLLLTLLYFAFSSHNKEILILFLLSLWVCIEDIVLPTWYFQGIEKMEYVTYISILNRILYLGAIFIFIKTSEDYWLIPLFNLIGSFITGFIVCFIIFKIQKVSLVFEKRDVIVHYFKESFPIFISNISIKLYVSTNKVILGSTLGMTQVAFYDLAEKVINLLKIPQAIITQSVFPRINKEKSVLFIKKMFGYSVGANILLALILFTTSSIIVKIIGGEQMLEAVPILNILGLTIPLVALSNIFGVQVLIPFGFSKTFSRVIIISGFLYLSLLYLLYFIKLINAQSVSIINLITELFVSLSMFYYCKKFKLW